MTSPALRLRLARFCFGGYAGFLFALTHWPHLRISSPIERPDLYIHLTAFCIWTCCAVIAGPFGPPLSARNLKRVALLAAVYAPFDEFSQGIPGVGRTVGLDDLAANSLGIVLALSICLILRKWRGVVE